MLAKSMKMKLEFYQQARNKLEAIRACGAIKKDKHVLLKLLDLGKLEAQAKSPLHVNFTQFNRNTNSLTHTL